VGFRAAWRRAGATSPLCSPEARHRPGFCQLAQLVETSKVIACVWLAVTGYTFDVIVRIDGEGRHRDVLLARFGG